MKKVFTILLVFILGINSFAAIVSDNDGSAFVTKAEFDALRKDFAEQIENYNESIDQKIDGAIAAYLAGLRLAQTVELELDPNCHYTFPLYYDPNNYWDNYTVTQGNKLFIPEFHMSQFNITIHGYINPGGRGSEAVWASGSKSTGVITINSVSNRTMASQFRNQVVTNVRYKWDYKGKNGILNKVTRLSGTRKINGTNYNLFNLDDEGIGRYIHSYKSTISNGSSNGNMFTLSNNYSTGTAGLVGVNSSQFTVSGSGTGIRWTVKNPSGTYTTTKLSKSYFAGRGGNWGNQNGITTYFPVGASLTANQISQYLHNNGGEAPSYDKEFVTENPVAQADEYTKPYSRTLIYSRNMIMPANRDYDYALTADLQKGTDTKYYVVGGATDTIRNLAGWSETRKTIYNKVSIYVMALPPLMTWKWHSTTKYAPTESEPFSYLPATLVTYKDSNGKDHYMDEGMYLGKIDQSGDVYFDVAFKRDYGTGTGTDLVLHVSKQPFSYDSTEANYIEYQIGNNKGTALQVKYGTNYTIKVPDLNKHDELYFEWIPVNDADLSSLTTFKNFKLITND